MTALFELKKGRGWMLIPAKLEFMQTYAQIKRKDGRFEIQRKDSNSGGNPRASVQFSLMEPPKAT
jgi:hypothetical protein